MERNAFLNILVGSKFFLHFLQNEIYSSLKKNKSSFGVRLKRPEVSVRT